MKSDNTAVDRRIWRNPRIVCWALYDWGNSAFATSVMVAFFPLAFNDYWSTGVPGARTTARLMLANGTASLVVALSMPLLGAIADRGGFRKLFLGGFATLGITATASLYWIPGERWLPAAAAFVLASIGFAAGNVFYDAMLTSITVRDRLDRVSAFGFALGYLGGGILLAVHVLMTLRPLWFGLNDAVLATRVVFLTVAAWWAVFSLPLFFFVPDVPRRRVPVGQAIRQGVSQLLGTFQRIRSLRPAFLFLLAYWLYIDGVNTLTKAAVDYAYKLDFGRSNLVLAILLVQFISFPSALAFGRLADWIGGKKSLLVGLAIYIAATGWAGFMSQVWELYVLASVVGVGQGGIYGLSRSFYARLVPGEQVAEFFGFYNMIGKFAAVLGPFAVAGVAQATGRPRLAVMAVLPLLVLGAVVLLRTPEQRDGKTTPGEEP